MSPELEVLDQLLGGDLPLNVIADLFPDPGHCQRAIAAMLHHGEVFILGPSNEPIPEWRYRDLWSRSDFWAQGTLYRLHITEVGAKRIG